MNVYPASCGVPCAAVASAKEQLESIFGSQFAIWTPGTVGWQCNHDSAVLPPNADAYLLSRELENWLEQLVLENVGSPRVATFFETTYVATIVKNELAAEVALLGRVELSLNELAQRAAASALNQAQKVFEIADRDELNHHYAARLSESFEELTFLRRLSRHVDCCVADRSLIDAAEAILPQLLELMNLEGVCLFAPTSGDPTDHLEGLMGHSGVVPDVKSLRDYVYGLGSRNQHVSVRNFDGEFDHSGEMIPVGVRSLAIAPVEKDDALFGWLVGINKLPADNCRAEIGSMEASLLEAAALMLGSHAANNQLFQEKHSSLSEVF